jgi:phosphoribosyl 1,2-cyclic phosphodiesterase
MEFTQKYSGSTGNLYTVTLNNGKRILIDPGVPYAKLMEALNYDLSGIDIALVSHGHMDHCKSVYDVIKAGITVYSSEATLKGLDVFGSRRAVRIESGTLLKFNDYQVLAFDTNHDAPDPLGFVIREMDTNEYLFFATDTSHIRQRFNLEFNIIAIECSFDREILQQRVDTQDINETLAKRLLTSHMEKENTKRYLREFCDLSKCREIHLLHMSGDNLNKTETQREFEDEFFIKTEVVKNGRTQIQR